MRRRFVLPVLLIFCGFLLIYQNGCSSCLSGPPIHVVNIIPEAQSSESNQDSEPFLAVNPANSQVMVASAFTPNEQGSSQPTAPVYISTDGGNTWKLNDIVQSQSTTGTGDITHAYGGTGGEFYGGILRRPGSLFLNELATSDPTSTTVMAVKSQRSPVDQPFVRATTLGGADRIYVGNNDLRLVSINGFTAAVDVSLDGGGSFKTFHLDSRSTADLDNCGDGSMDGPSVRPSVAKDGTVYAAYFGWRTFTPSIVDQVPNCNDATVITDVVVVRDDSGATGTTAFQDLVDSDGKAGVRVAQGVTVHWSNQPTLGQERTGSTLSFAVDPNNSSTVYIAWADVVGNGDIQTVHVRTSKDRGKTWSNDLFALPNTTNPALAVADNGTVGILDQSKFFAGDGLWVTVLSQTRDDWAHEKDTLLAFAPGDAPVKQFLPYLGDYVGLLAVGNEFRGIFCLNNTPDPVDFFNGVSYQRSANFTTKTLGNGVPVSIDPFYFTVPVIQQ